MKFLKIEVGQYYAKQQIVKCKFSSKDDSELNFFLNRIQEPFPVPSSFSGYLKEDPSGPDSYWQIQSSNWRDCECGECKIHEVAWVGNTNYPTLRDEAKLYMPIEFKHYGTNLIRSVWIDPRNTLVVSFSTEGIVLTHKWRSLDLKDSYQALKLINRLAKQPEAIESLLNAHSRMRT